MFLMQKRYTLKDLKCEAALMICSMLIDNYLTIEKEGKSSSVIEGIPSDNLNVIYNIMKQLHLSLYANILIVEKLQKIKIIVKKIY